MSERVAIVGAGIVGLAHAWREAVRGAEVTLFERSPLAEGASIRNFGMVWPIGQPKQHREAALRSRALWDEFVRETGVWCHREGSFHLAIREDELQVLTEFADLAPSLGYDCRVLGPVESRSLCPATGEDVVGGLFSPQEMGVDPREVIAIGPRWLADRFHVKLEFSTAVHEIDLPTVSASDGRTWEFDRVTIASGADFATLYPDLFAEHALARCKLQMMRTVPQPASWKMGPMVASGLTLRHYANFDVCESLAPLRRRIAEETPELDRYGIHVMAAQNGSGEVVLGDSHEYGDQITPFDRQRITNLILAELHKTIDLPAWELSARWHGIYAIQPSGEPQFVASPTDGVSIVIATGGCGMTMSFGLAEQLIARREASLSPIGACT